MVFTQKKIHGLGGTKHLEILSFVTIWFFEFCHNFFLSFVKIQVFSFCHKGQKKGRLIAEVIFVPKKKFLAD